jgi:hypothetical protein
MTDDLWKRVLAAWLSAASSLVAPPPTRRTLTLSMDAGTGAVVCTLPTAAPMHRRSVSPRRLAARLAANVEASGAGAAIERGDM